MTAPASHPVLSLDGLVLPFGLLGGDIPRDADGVGWLLTGLSGWSASPAPRTARADRPHGHGAYRSPSFRGVRVLGLDLLITAPREDLLRAAERRVIGVCADGEQLYRLAVDDPAVGPLSCDVELDDAPIVTHLSRAAVTASVQVAAPDPRRYGPWQVAAASLPALNAGVGIDATAPGIDGAAPGIDAGPPTEPAYATTRHEGTATAGVVIEFVGPVQTPEVVVPVTGERIVYRDHVPSGTSVLINTGDFPALDVPPRSALFDGRPVDHLVGVTGWPQVAPGGQLWRFIAPNYDPAATLRVHYRPAYW